MINCAVPKNTHTPPQKGLEFPGGRRLYETKKLKNCMKLNRNSQRDWEVLDKNPFGGGMDTFWN